MVSKLEILARYYQISVDKVEQGYFVYRDVYYYISDKTCHPFVMNYYEYYLHLLKVPGFYRVKNCYGHYESDGYVLYCYQLYKIEIESYLSVSSMMLQREMIEIKDVKLQWCQMIDEARSSISRHASSIQLNEQFVVLSYYYQGLAEHAIQILNLIEKTKIPTSIQHINSNTEYQYVVAPDNLTVSSRVRNIVEGYKKGYFTLHVIEQCICQYRYTPEELTYMYARMIFPSEFFKVEKENIHQETRKFYRQLAQETYKIKELRCLLCQYVMLPSIDWI